jgi:hypothetical protein
MWFAAVLLTLAAWSAASLPVGPTDIHHVDTVAALRAAVRSAQPGDVILLADGDYLLDERLQAIASGTPGAPITLRGSRGAVLLGEDDSSDYALHVTGDRWRIEGLTVAHARKGIVLDGSIGTVIAGVEVRDIAEEGVHFRRCSSDGVLRDSYVHDTGLAVPGFGEGAYVGSAHSNWPDHECSDRLEGRAVGDNTERVVIEDNLFEDIPAEGVDLKEGTDSGLVRGNVFSRVGTSGRLGADSAIAVKGNGWLIEDNLVVASKAGSDRDSGFEDGFQVLRVHDGYGEGNRFHRNQVLGPIPGFGISLWGSDNTVWCDNTAADAARGLVGHDGSAADCVRSASLAPTAADGS